MQKKILIVGESSIPKESVSPRGEEEWSFYCMGSSLEAIGALRDVRFTAVVADATLTGAISGRTLLNEAMRLQPRALRFIRAEPNSLSALGRDLGGMHRLIVGPLDRESVQQAVADGLAMETWLPFERVQHLFSRLSSLPSAPGIYFQVVRQLQSVDSSLEEIGETIRRDPALTSKLLQLVNSAAFGLHRQVGEPGEAVSHLGFETTKSVILFAHSVSRFEKLARGSFSLDAFSRHSFRVARFAQQIAQLESADSEFIGECFTAGLLHDLGALVLAANLPEESEKAFQMAKEQGMELWQAELEVLGTHHGELGACLLSTWGMPARIVESAGLHQHPIQLQSTGFSTLVAVHVANVWARAADPVSQQVLPPQLDQEYLKACGCLGRLDEWEQSIVARMEPVAHAVGF